MSSLTTSTGDVLVASSVEASTTTAANSSRTRGSSDSTPLVTQFINGDRTSQSSDGNVFASESRSRAEGGLTQSQTQTYVPPARIVFDALIGGAPSHAAFCTIIGNVADALVGTVSGNDASSLPSRTAEALATIVNLVLAISSATGLTATSINSSGSAILHSESVQNVFEPIPPSAIRVAEDGSCDLDTVRSTLEEFLLRVTENVKSGALYAPGETILMASTGRNVRLRDITRGYRLFFRFIAHALYKNAILLESQKEAIKEPSDASISPARASKSKKGKKRGRNASRSKDETPVSSQVTASQEEQTDAVTPFAITIINVLAVMNESRSRGIRYAAAEAINGIASAFTEIVALLEVERKASLLLLLQVGQERQLKLARDGDAGGEGTTGEYKDSDAIVACLQKNVARLQNQVEFIKGKCINCCFTLSMHNRIKDVSPEIRLLSARQLREWFLADVTYEVLAPYLKGAHNGVERGKRSVLSFYSEMHFPALLDAVRNSLTNKRGTLNRLDSLLYGEGSGVEGIDERNGTQGIRVEAAEANMYLNSTYLRYLRIVLNDKKSAAIRAEGLETLKALLYWGLTAQKAVDTAISSQGSLRSNIGSSPRSNNPLFERVMPLFRILISRLAEMSRDVDTRVAYLAINVIALIIKTEASYKVYSYESTAEATESPSSKKVKRSKSASRSSQGPNPPRGSSTITVTVEPYEPMVTNEHLDTIFSCFLDARIAIRTATGLLLRVFMENRLHLIEAEASISSHDRRTVEGSLNLSIQDFAEKLILAPDNDKTSSSQSKDLDALKLGVEYWKEAGAVLEAALAAVRNEEDKDSCQRQGCLLLIALCSSLKDQTRGMAEEYIVDALWADAQLIPVRLQCIWGQLLNIAVFGLTAGEIDEQNSAENSLQQSLLYIRFISAILRRQRVVAQAGSLNEGESLTFSGTLGPAPKDDLDVSAFETNLTEKTPCTPAYAKAFYLVMSTQLCAALPLIMERVKLQGDCGFALFADLITHLDLTGIVALIDSANGVRTKTGSNKNAKIPAEDFFSLLKKIIHMMENCCIAESISVPSSVENMEPAIRVLAFADTVGSDKISAAWRALLELNGTVTACTLAKCARESCVRLANQSATRAFESVDTQVRINALACLSMLVLATESVAEEANRVLKHASEEEDDLARWYICHIMYVCSLWRLRSEVEEVNSDGNFSYSTDNSIAVATRFLLSEADRILFQTELPAEENVLNLLTASEVLVYACDLFVLLPKLTGGSSDASLDASTTVKLLLLLESLLRRIGVLHQRLFDASRTAVREALSDVADASTSLYSEEWARFYGIKSALAVLEQYACRGINGVQRLLALGVISVNADAASASGDCGLTINDRVAFLLSGWVRAARGAGPMSGGDAGSVDVSVNDVFKQTFHAYRALPATPAATIRSVLAYTSGGVGDVVAAAVEGALAPSQLSYNLECATILAAIEKGFFLDLEGRIATPALVEQQAKEARCEHLLYLSLLSAKLASTHVSMGTVDRNYHTVVAIVDWALKRHTSLNALQADNSAALGLGEAVARNAVNMLLHAALPYAMKLRRVDACAFASKITGDRTGAAAVSTSLAEVAAGPNIFFNAFVTAIAKSAKMTMNTGRVGGTDAAEVAPTPKRNTRDHLVESPIDQELTQALDMDSAYGSISATPSADGTPMGARNFPRSSGVAGNEGNASPVAGADRLRGKNDEYSETFSD